MPSPVVAPQHPLHADQRQDEPGVHQRRQDILAADEATIEEAECRGHQHDQGSGSQQPGGVASIDRGRARSRHCRKRAPPSDGRYAATAVCGWTASATGRLVGTSARIGAMIQLTSRAAKPANENSVRTASMSMAPSVGPQDGQRPRSIGPKTVMPDWALRTKIRATKRPAAQAGDGAAVVPYH